MKEEVYEIVRNIPYGKVMTYKQIAILLGNIHYARVIGNILHQNKDVEDVPCYKVVNHQGHLAKHYAFGGIDGQKKYLEREGIEVYKNKVDLKRYGVN